MGHRTFKAMTTTSHTYFVRSPELAAGIRALQVPPETEEAPEGADLKLTSWVYIKLLSSSTGYVQPRLVEAGGASCQEGVYEGIKGEEGVQAPCGGACCLPASERSGDPGVAEAGYRSSAAGARSRVGGDAS